MRILISIQILFIVSFLKGQDLTAYVVENGTTASHDFTVSVVFDAAAAGPVLFENSTLAVFIDGGYTGADVTSEQGGSFTTTLIPGSSLGPCASDAGGRSLLQIQAGSQANLGDIASGVNEILATVVLMGPGDPATPVTPLDPGMGDALSACLIGLGLDNTASVDYDGNGGNGTTNYSNVEGGAPFLLPVTLKSFAAEKYTDNSSLLEWVSATEVNASHFEIERTTDFVEWTTLGNVKAAGESNSDIYYEYVDRDLPLSGRVGEVIFYYRLKMVDKDGTHAYSNVEGVTFDVERPEQLTVYPNPTRGDVYVSVGGVSQSGTTAYITDRAGQVVKKATLYTGMVERVSLQELPTGVYQLSVEIEGELQTQKVIKMD